MNLDGQKALVTGGARGIGRAISDALARHGADVVILDLLDDEGHATAAELSAQHGRQVRFVHADITDDSEVEKAVAAGVAEIGPITTLVSNAGWKRTGPAHLLPVEDYDRTMAVHSRGLFLLTRYCVPHMVRAGGGSIIAISSMQALLGLPGRLAYSAAKGAITASVRQLAVDYGPFGVRANAILPGAIMTELNLARHQQDLTDDEFEALRKSYPMRRFGTPEDIANAAVFLASDYSTWVTGTNMLVDGGASIQLAEAALYTAYDENWQQTAELLADPAS
jgi:NAD(P)-dependent dehydrogenase (short-subunit alcohol dehydrogenase family)